MDKICNFYLYIINTKINYLKCKTPKVHLLKYLKANSIQYKRFIYKKWVINFYNSYNIINHLKYIFKIKYIINSVCSINFE
jgi:hypothetical protein